MFKKKDDIYKVKNKITEINTQMKIILFSFDVFISEKIFKKMHPKNKRMFVKRL